MKSKITSFIMTIISILIVSILVLLGIIIYDEFANTDVAKDVQDFVTNVTVTGEKNQSVKVPDKIIETTVDSFRASDLKSISIFVLSLFLSSFISLSKIDSI